MRTYVCVCVRVCGCVRTEVSNVHETGAGAAHPRQMLAHHAHSSLRALSEEGTRTGQWRVRRGRSRCPTGRRQTGATPRVSEAEKGQAHSSTAADKCVRICVFV